MAAAAAAAAKIKKMWDELKIDSLADVSASRRDAITGIPIRIYSHVSYAYVGKPVIIHWALVTPMLHMGLFGHELSEIRRALKYLSTIGRSGAFHHADGPTTEASRRILADLRCELCSKFARRLFRWLRQRAFRRNMRSRVRAKLVITRSVVFGGLPAEIVRSIAQVWL